MVEQVEQAELVVAPEDGKKIDTGKLIDPEVVLHPEIFKWRDALTVDLGLLNSLRDGQIQPIVFRLKDGKHELLVGSRRYFHQKLLGTPWDDILKDVREKVSERDALLMAASENIFRKDFSPWEEARAIESLVKKGRVKPKDLAKRLGVSVSYIQSRRALMQLPENVRRRFEATGIPIGYAVPGKKLKGMEEAQMTLLEKVESGMENNYSGISTIEEADNFVNRVLKKVKDTEELIAKYGVCPKCEGKNIVQSYRDDDALSCEDCGHEWHKETKEPWAYYEMKQNAQAMGFEVEEGPEKVKFTPREVAQMIEDKAEEEREKEEDAVEKIPEKFRSNIPLEGIMTPLLAENIQKIVVRGSSIEIQLIEDSELNFKGLKKDYKAGEKARIEVLTAYSMDTQDSAKRIHAHIQKVASNQ